MSKTYTVHSAVVTPFHTTVKLKDGREVMAAVPALLVELVADDEGHATITHRELYSSEEESKAAIELFGVGNKVALGDFTLVEKAKND